MKREAKPVREVTGFRRQSFSLHHERQIPPKLVVLGASAVDITSSADGIAGTSPGLVNLAQTTTPGTISLTVGGVARNIAEAAHRVLSSESADGSSATTLVTPIGDDGFSRILLSEQHRLGMRSDGFLTVKGESSAVCNMLLDSSGALFGGVADMDIVQNIDESKV